MNTISSQVRIACRLLGATAILLAVAWLVTLALGKAGGSRMPTVPADTELLARGAYVEKLADCGACHTAPGGREFAGGLPIPTPIGKIYSSNITPDQATGIGRYTLDDFERAVRRGIRPDGTSLYPAMPFPSYARISTPDLQALYVYFTRSVAPISQLDRAADIPWPLSLRWPLTYWRWLFAPRVKDGPDTAGDPYARGAYIVEGLGHCGSCHTPRGLWLQEKALTAADGPAYLSGAVVDHYVAANLRGDPLTGLGSFTEDDIVRLLQTGRTSSTAVFGGMTDVVSRSTQYMSQQDLHAVARYLKTLPGGGEESPFSYDSFVGNQLAAGRVQARGARDYLNNCAACHLFSGRGYQDMFPALAGNPITNGRDPSSLISIVLRGASIPATERTPTAFTMPPFAGTLTDEQVADVVTFIRTSWGNHAPAVSPPQVQDLRRAIGASFGGPDLPRGR